MKTLIIVLSLLVSSKALSQVYLTEHTSKGDQRLTEIKSYAITTQGGFIDLTLKVGADESMTYRLSHENLKYIFVSPVELGSLLEAALNSEKSELHLLIKDGGEFRGHFLSEVSFR